MYYLWLRIFGLLTSSLFYLPTPDVFPQWDPSTATPMKDVCESQERVSYLPNPSTRAGYDTRSIFKRSLTGLNSFPTTINITPRAPLYCYNHNVSTIFVCFRSNSGVHTESQTEAFIWTTGVALLFSPSVNHDRVQMLVLPVVGIEPATSR